MRITSILLCFLLYAMPVHVKARDAGNAIVSHSVRRFVQAFYDWYVSKALTRRSAPAWSTAVKVKWNCFSPELGRELREDSEAQAKAQGEIVGLDFDPFLNGQDPGRHYSADKVVSRGDSYFVEVHRVVSSKPEAELTVTAELTGKPGHWNFVNFHYPNNQNLVGVLKILKNDRTKTDLG